MERIRVRRRGVFVAAYVMAAILVSGSLMAASKTYKYRCPKCKLIQEYESPGVKKCPNDGKTILRMD